MTTPAAAHARPSSTGYLLAALVLFLAACGDNDAAKAVAVAAPTEYMRPVGEVSEVDAKLFKAAGTGDSEGVAEAIEEGANVNAADALKRTPLFGAAFLDRADAASLLVAHGADVNAKDFSGFSPLHAAVVVGGTQVVATLIAKGAAINARIVGGRTPLHLAAATDQPLMVELLLKNGANPQAKDSEGLTPAALAARNGHSGISDRLKRRSETRQPDSRQ